MKKVMVRTTPAKLVGRLDRKIDELEVEVSRAMANLTDEERSSKKLSDIVESENKEFRNRLTKNSWRKLWWFLRGGSGPGTKKIRSTQKNFSTSKMWIIYVSSGKSNTTWSRRKPNTTTRMASTPFILSAQAWCLLL